MRIILQDTLMLLKISRTHQKLQKQWSFEASDPELFPSMGNYLLKSQTEHDCVTCETHLSISSDAMPKPERCSGSKWGTSQFHGAMVQHPKAIGQVMVVGSGRGRQIVSLAFLFCFGSACVSKYMYRYIMLCICMCTYIHIYI